MIFILTEIPFMLFFTLSQKILQNKYFQEK